MTENNKTALGFIRVLDLSESVAGQYCCRMLADYGADVVLVEPPSGSVVRKMGPFREARGAEAESLLFYHLNLGKSSVVVDLTTDAGKALLSELAKAADVMVVPAGFDRSILRKANP